MLRVSHLRKLVKPSAQCREILVDLLGTEVGAPVSAGHTVEVLAGTVTATGAGYDFIDGILRVSTTKKRCPLTSEMTFSITGTGPVPELAVRANEPIERYLIAVQYDTVYAVYTYPHTNWVSGAYVSVPAGAPYELKCSIADTWVGVWLNGTRIARAEVTPGYLATSAPWYVTLGRYYYGTYTGHVDSASLVTGSLPDIDVL